MPYASIASGFAVTVMLITRGSRNEARCRRPAIRPHTIRPIGGTLGRSAGRSGYAGVEMRSPDDALAEMGAVGGRRVAAWERRSFAWIRRIQMSGFTLHLSEE